MMMMMTITIGILNQSSTIDWWGGGGEKKREREKHRSNKVMTDKETNYWLQHWCLIVNYF